jgi:hypothetical protein
MNWDAIGAVSGLLSAVALIATLVYVAVQIRQNTSALRSTATQGTHEQVVTLYDLLASDGELSETFVCGLNAPDALNRIQTARFYALLLGLMFRYQNWFLQTRSHALEEDHIVKWTQVLRKISGTPGFKKFWHERRFTYTSAMVQYLENEGHWGVFDPEYHPMGVRLEDSSL